MGRVFNFKLKGLLKIREFREYKSKLELSNITNKLQKLNDDVTSIKEGIIVSYDKQKKLMKNSVDKEDLEILYNSIDLSRKIIDNKEKEIDNLKQLWSIKKKELNKKRADRKIISNIKDREFNKFKKELNKKYYQEIEDIFIMNNK